MSLVAQCHDPTSRVHHLRNNLAIIFATAGLFDQSSLSLPARIEFNKDKSLTKAVALIVVKRNQNPVPSRTPPGTFMPWRTGIDPRDLTRTFKDFVWAENIRLERLSICSLGVAKQSRRAGPDAKLSEECSVPL